MRELIVGTAGHVDHGKTALIEAMTGYNGDETAQERERGITIDLSFSNMRREGVNVAFIDVPGHERLVKNMVSGAFGFDAALLVIAADEGIMPQTLEHLAVLRIVGVERIVVALSKADRVDEATLRRRKEEVEALFAQSEGPRLVGVLPTSIHDGASIERLKDLLFGLEARRGEDAPFFRYYIDRLFSPKGVGTVVTGTVLSGRIERGQKITVAELGKAAAVRAIQIHGRESEEAHTHQRAALQLDLPYTQLQKGFLLCSRGYFRGFTSIDVHFKERGDAPPHGSEVLFITGSKRIEARILYYADERYALLRLSQKAFTRFGDPFVVLHKGRLAGGGEVLVPISEPIRKNRKIPLLDALRLRDFPKAFEILLHNHARGFGLTSSQQRFALSHEEALAIARGIEGAFVDEKALVLYPAEAMDRVRRALEAIYEHNPQALLSPAAVTLRMRWASEALVAEVMNRMLDEGVLKEARGLYLRADQDEQQLQNGLEERIYRVLDEEGITPEAPYNLYDRLMIDRKEGDRVLKALSRRKKVIRLAHNLFVTEGNLRRVLEMMKAIMQEEGYIDIRLFKAKSSMSRKYCIAYLEYLDKSGGVIREGERRRARYGG